MKLAKNLLHHHVLFTSVLISFSLLSFSCSQKKSSDQKHWSLIDEDLQNKIFSNRPQKTQQTVVLLKLPTLPLFKTVKAEAGKKVIDAEQAKKIEQEQNELIETLKKLSPEIKVLFRYRLVLNAVSVVVPAELVEKVNSLPGIIHRERSQAFSRPAVLLAESHGTATALGSVNSVNFIGADKVHQRGLKGQGQKIGIIDTGIDYTHSMLGGVGTTEAYKAIDPAKPNAMFPNQKVVNGIDLVGTSFNGASDVAAERIPTPDANPIDEAGHGTHVAGTVAGIGDNKKTYSGVAPEASLYAIKVFGAVGSTTDEVVIAAMEWAADPNQDLDFKDQLDVVNLSLGSEFGSRHIMYTEAVENLSQGGTVVVASAGNSGPQQHIVGSPSVADEAISVAATVDGMEHNWKFAAVRFEFESAETQLAEAVEGPASKPIAEAGEVQGNIVYVGTANEDFSAEVLEKIKGNVALVDRGGKYFIEKLTRAAKAGAIGVILANNQEGPPFAMGLGGPEDKPIEAPAIMITKALGDKLKQELLASRKVRIHFKTNERIEKPEMIDSITGFSSQGPRFEDALIKPEISAPGQNIISAAMGKGSEPIQLSGTSMSAPHISGVMALIKQSHPELSVRELKSILMGTAKSIEDSGKGVYPVSRMGAGRVQVESAVHASVISGTTALSLGVMSVEGQKTLRRSITLKNLTSGDLKLKLSFQGARQLKISEQNVEIKSFSTARLNLDIQIVAEGLKVGPNELSGLLVFKDGEKEVFRIPALALVAPVSQVKASSLVVRSTSAVGAAGSAVDLVLKNSSQQDGTALLFNLIATDARKADPQQSAVASHACDLQAAGYRLINGKLQLSIKLYDLVTTWHRCEISVQIDADGDGVADQELVGVPADRLEGMQGKEFTSLLLNATKAREIRKKYEADLEAALKDPAAKRPAAPNYTSAIEGADSMKVYNSSSIALVQMDMGALKLKPTGEFSVKIATSALDEVNLEADDFLGEKEWLSLDLNPKGQAFDDIPESITVGGGAETQVSLTKGEGSMPLMVLYPQNHAVLGVQSGDEQLELPLAGYKP